LKLSQLEFVALPQPPPVAGSRAPVQLIFGVASESVAAGGVAAKTLVPTNKMIHPHRRWLITTP
jgi:hypothetical protein